MIQQCKSHDCWLLLLLLLTEGNTALGVSSPAYPALVCQLPRSSTTALTSSA
jgi:hypothetical protein